MANTIRKLWMSVPLHNALTELAWQSRTTPSDILRDIIIEVAKEPTPKWMAKADEGPGPMNRSVSLSIEDEDWQAARDATWPSRVSLAKQVRLRLVRLAERHGVTVAAA